jgi:hypothetical protein
LRESANAGHGVLMNALELGSGLWPLGSGAGKLHHLKPNAPKAAEADRLEPTA